MYSYVGHIDYPDFGGQSYRFDGRRNQMSFSYRNGWLECIFDDDFDGVMGSLGDMVWYTYIRMR